MSIYLDYQIVHRGCGFDYICDKMTESFGEFLQNYGTSVMNESSHKKTIKLNKKVVKKIDDGREKIYFLTLTCVKRKPFELYQSLQKIINSKMFKIKKYVYSWELTKQGDPHIHMLYTTDVYNDASKMLPINNMERINLKMVPRKEYFVVLNYILKDSQSTNMHDYCTNNKIDQIVSSHQLPKSIPTEKYKCLTIAIEEVTNLVDDLDTLENEL